VTRLDLDQRSKRLAWNLAAMIFWSKMPYVNNTAAVTQQGSARHRTSLQFYRLQFDWMLASSVQRRWRRSKIQDGTGIGASWQ
jgi:hypothetical protein